MREKPRRYKLAFLSYVRRKVTYNSVVSAHRGGAAHEITSKSWTLAVPQDYP